MAITRHEAITHLCQLYTVAAHRPEEVYKTTRRDIDLTISVITSYDVYADDARLALESLRDVLMRAAERTDDSGEQAILIAWAAMALPVGKITK